MTARAATAEETGRRLIGAMQTLFAERPYAEWSQWKRGSSGEN